MMRLYYDVAEMMHVESSPSCRVAELIVMTDRRRENINGIEGVLMALII